MKRYKQGFHNFGSLEFNEDGDWVKYSDVLESNERTQEILNVAINEVNELNLCKETLKSDHQNEIEYWSRKIAKRDDTIQALTSWKKKLEVSFLVVTALFVIEFSILTGKIIERVL